MGDRTLDDGVLAAVPEPVDRAGDLPAASGILTGAPTIGRRAAVSRHPLWRRSLVWVCLIIGLVLLPLAVTGGWARTTIYDRDGFVGAIAPLGADPAIQEQVAASVTDRLFSAVDLENRLTKILPGFLERFARPVTDGLQTQTLDAARAFTASDQFKTVWTTGVRGAHGSVVGFLDGSGSVYVGDSDTITIDLTPVSTPLVNLLAKVGIDISAEDHPILVTGQVPIVKVPDIEKFRGILHLTNRLFVVLTVLAAFFLIISLVLAESMQRVFLRLGAGTMVSMAVFALGIAAGHTYFLQATADAGVSDEAAGSLWGALSITLRATAWGLFAAGLLVCVVAYVLWVLARRREGRAGTGAAERRRDAERAGRFVAKYRIPMALAVLVVGFLVIVLSGGPPVWRVILTAAIVLVADALILLVARLNEPVQTPGADPTDAPS